MLVQNNFLTLAKPVDVNAEPEVYELWLPAHFASYLINLDASGLEDGEVEQIDNFLDHNNFRIINVSEDEPVFKWSNDLNSLGDNCLLFTAYKY